MTARQMSPMRQEALRRARDMRRLTAEQEQTPRLELSPSPTPAPGAPGLNEKLREILGEGLSGDRLLTAALILLLLKEGADKSLVLALGYIML